MYLPEPEHCSIDLINNVVRERQNGINAAYFTEIKDEWKIRTQQYITHKGSPEHVSQWTALTTPRKTSFRTLYLSPKEGSAQGVVLNDLDDHDLVICPACGELGRPNTLDHYLPKGKFPHFSITPVNLTPMCDRCQKEKKEKTNGPNEPRFFLHPYYDEFLVNQVLEIVIEPPFDKPTFRIVIARWLTAEQRSVVKSHLRELAIEKRFARFFKRESVRILKLAAQARASRLDVPQAIELFRSSAEDPSINGWQHLYFASVLANPPMIEYLTNGRLPGTI
ncbi:hypothetical protein [Pseudomonas syringae]|uniref:hypothetical protein n=1 Tax=Pseudomonas syringae TaxID=317 RepID=UPI003F7525FF